MSTAARKIRKRSGEKFVRIAKVGTPLEDRQVPVVTDRNGRVVGPIINHFSKRVWNRLAERIKLRDAE